MPLVEICSTPNTFGCSFLPDNLESSGTCVWSTTDKFVKSKEDCSANPTKFPCGYYLTTCTPAPPLPPICDETRGDHCVDCTNIGYTTPQNFWNPDGTLAPIPVGTNANIDLGSSCQGAPCRNPGNDTKNGIGCGWQPNKPSPSHKN